MRQTAECPRSGPWYRGLVVLYDRAYRRWHRLDVPGARVGPALCIEIQRTRRDTQLRDGTVVHRRKQIGVLHLNNDRIRSMHSDDSSAATVGFECRRQLFVSLQDLARQTDPGGPLSEVEAFAATTIFHRSLRHLGFEPESKPAIWSGLVGFYQRLLLSVLHPAGRARLSGRSCGNAQRLWISRATLRRLYRYPRLRPTSPSLILLPGGRDHEVDRTHTAAHAAGGGRR